MALEAFDRLESKKKSNNGWLKLVILTVVILSLWSSVLSSLYFVPKADQSFGEPTATSKSTDSKSEESGDLSEGIVEVVHKESVLESPDEIVEVVQKESDVKLPAIDWSDRIFQRSGWDKDPIVIESHKLLFFTVPKNACTTFKKLFRRMMGYEDWFTKGPHDPTKNGLRYLGHYSKEQQEMMMTSPEWTRAIFVRDPLERTLSAYKDKALQAGDTDRWTPPVTGAYLKRLCCGMLPGKKATAKKMSICHSEPLSPYEYAMNSSNFPFETFVDKVMDQCKDPHWHPQSERLDSKSNWQFINFVGKFENQMADTHKLLRRIGAFDEFGASGWDLKNSTLAIFETNTALHKTGSSKKMDQYYTDVVRKRVFEHYRGDYELELFNFTNPIE